MNILPLIIALHKSFLLADSIELITTQAYQKDNKTITSFWKSVSLQHNTITLQMRIKKDVEKRTMSTIYLEAKFNILNQNCTLSNFYCNDNTLEETLRAYLAENTPTFDTTTKATAPFNEEALMYLSIADEVAKQTYLCASGDDYYPGYYSTITIEETQIILTQINRTNARSINHKNDYFMRDLEFFIPTTSTDLVGSFNDQKIGRMIVRFQDHSTTNNKTCGDRIREKLEEVSRNFKQ